MGILVICLFIISVILFSLEIVVPGGIFGILGLTMFFISSIVIVLYMPYGLELTLGIAALLSFIMYRMFKFLRNKQIHKKIILNETLGHEKIDSTELNYLVDKVGIIKTPLKPQGTAEFNGVIFEVFSTGDYIGSGKRVKVISIDNGKIIVKNVEQ